MINRHRGKKKNSKQRKDKYGIRYGRQKLNSNDELKSKIGLNEKRVLVTIEKIFTGNFKNVSRQRRVDSS